MSTNINISVGDNNLLNQARLQQNASRQAQLEKEANKRLQIQATDTRTTTLASLGLDASGNLLTGARNQALELERRPAANRLAGGVILTPRKAPIGSVPIPPLVTPEGVAASKNSNALRYQENFGDFFVPTRSIGTSELPTTISLTDPGLFSTFGPSPGKYSVRITDYSTPGTFVGGDRYHSIAAQTLGSTKKMPVGANSPFTVEAWVYVPNVDPPIPNNNGYVYSVKVSLLANVYGAYNYPLPYPGATGWIPITAVSADISQNSGTQTGYEWAALFTDGVGGPSLDRRNEAILNTLVVGQWNHLAFWHKNDRIYWFVNGQLLVYVDKYVAGAGNNAEPSFLTYAETALEAVATLRYAPPFPFSKTNKNDIMAMRGVRFTPKHLYPITGFTPVMY
jgi:hypothetical protein